MTRTKSSTRSRLTALVFLALLLAPVSGGAGEVTTGRADATSILVRIVSGAGTVSIGTDDASVSAGTNPRAFARFVTGQALEQQIGATERTTTTKGDKADASVGDEDVRIGDFIELGTTGAGITTEVADDVTSTVTAGLGGVSLMRGLVVADDVTSTTVARTGDAGSHVERTISITGFRALALGDFLSALNVSPLSLGCEAIEELGVLLGATGVTCAALLDDVSGLIAGAIDALQAAEAQIIAARDAVLDAIADAEAALATANDVIDTLQAQLSDLGAQIDDLSAARAILTQNRDTLEANLDGLVATESSLAGQVAAAQAEVVGLTREQVQDDRDSVTSCDALTGLAALLCQADLMLNSFPDLASTYGVTLPGVFGDARDALLAAMDAALATFDEIDVLEDELAAVSAQVADLNSQIDGVTVQIDDLTSQIDPLVTQLDGVQDAIDAANEAIDALQTELAALQADLVQLLADIELIDAEATAGPTCEEASAALTDVANRVPSLAGDLDSIAADLDAACADLSGEVKEVLDIPLISVDGIDITIDVHAREDDPSVAVTGTIGSVQIGNLAPVVVDLPAGSNEIPVAQGLISASLSAISTAIGIDVPAPEFGFLVTEQDAGQHANGTWFAEGSVTFLRLSFPAHTLTVPDEPPLSALEGMDPSFTVPEEPGFGALASAQVPETTLDVATFDASGMYAPASGDTITPGPDLDGGTVGKDPRGSAGRIPRTGVAGFGLFGPAVTFAAAALLRRWLVRR